MVHKWIVEGQHAVKDGGERVVDREICGVVIWNPRLFSLNTLVHSRDHVLHCPTDIVEDESGIAEGDGSLRKELPPLHPFVSTDPNIRYWISKGQCWARQNLLCLVELLDHDRVVDKQIVAHQQRNISNGAIVLTQFHGELERAESEWEETSKHRKTQWP